MPAGKKFYVVWKGRRTGVFATWKECEAQVKGFTGARFKSFPNREAAEEAFLDRPVRRRRGPTTARLWDYSLHPPITASISVDAACSGNPGRLEWRGVHTATGKELFHKGPFPEGTNNIGEFLAIVDALAGLKEAGNASPVYTDSGTGLAWLRVKKCRTRLKRSRQNAALFELIQRAEEWLRNNDYPNRVLKWDTEDWGEIPADFNRK